MSRNAVIEKPLAARSGEWRFEWRRSWAEVWDHEFVRRWESLFESAAHRHVFHRPALIRAWAETCGRAVGVEPFVGIASHTSGACVLIPWATRLNAGRMVRRRVLTYAGDDLFGYHDPMCSNDQKPIEWPAFWMAARHEIGNLCDQALFRFVHRYFVSGEEPSGGDSPVLQLAGHADFEALLASCSPNHRGDVRRRRRRLAERGTIALWIAGRDEAAKAAADWDANGRPAYSASWNDRATRNLAWRPGYDEFLSRTIADGVAEGWGHYAALTVAGEPIAWHVGLADRGRLYWSVPAHRADWESYSPGKVLLSLMVERLLDDGWSELHFQTGSHPYKMAWRPAPADVRVVRWQAAGLRGAVLSWYDALRRGA
jgi:CelD/BcsL family acetyltransferase involved in cellulose biosynthesis